MDKDFILGQIHRLIEARQLWEEMSNHIYALGGELWETKYAEAYYYHECLVYDLILEYRGYPSLSDYEFEDFQESIFNFARKEKEIKIFDIHTNEIVMILSSVEDIFNWLTQPQSIYLPEKETVN